MLRIKSLLILVFCAAGLFTPVCAQRAAEIWVSPAGDDANPGTREKPKAGILMAQRQARELRRLHDPSAREGIRIILQGGLYCLDEPLVFRPEDSGTADSPTIIMAAEGENPVISGGVKVTGWKRAASREPRFPAETKGKLWCADMPREGGRLSEFRQLWVNGKKAVRASTLGDGSLPRLLSVDREKEILWIPDPAFSVQDPGQLELVIHQWWAVANLRVKALRRQGDSLAVTFHQPESRIEFEHPWPAPYIDKEKNKNGNSAFYFVNAPELLNQPGEWYADLDQGKVYYWPREGEDLTTAEVIVPRLETLVRINGTVDHPVHHLSFHGISFSHTGWLRPSRQGHVPLQAGFSLTDAYNLPVKGTPDKATLCNQAWVERQPAAVSVRFGSDLTFEGCRFEHLAATGLDLIEGTCHNLINGNRFADIGGTGIQAGFFGDGAFEAHLPYDPADGRMLCRYETLSNNLITDVTNEDWGCLGIAVGFAHDITIANNEISDVNYSGISVGWGWTKTIGSMKNNRIIANHIHHFAKNMYDVGGIYMLGAQPNSEIRGNAIHHLEKAPYAHDPNHYQYIYFDEGSSFIRAMDNWTEADKFFSNTPGPGNEWVNNGPQVGDSIKNAAGILPQYRHLLNSLPLQSPFPVRTGK
jgi:hypothetical protein